MLYELIQNAVLPNLQSLNSIERLGGLVKVVSSEYQDANGRIVRQSFPIAAGVSYADCFNNGMYQSLCPDSSKSRSLFSAKSRRRIALAKGRVDIQRCCIRYSLPHGST